MYKNKQGQRDFRCLTSYQLHPRDWYGKNSHGITPFSNDYSTVCQACVYCLFAPKIFSTTVVFRTIKRTRWPTYTGLDDCFLDRTTFKGVRYLKRKYKRRNVHRCDVTTLWWDSVLYTRIVHETNEIISTNKRDFRRRGELKIKASPVKYGSQTALFRVAADGANEISLSSTRASRSEISV